MACKNWERWDLCCPLTHEEYELVFVLIMVHLWKLVKEVWILSRMLLEEKQLWREMVRDIFVPIWAHYIFTATGSMTKTIPKGGPGVEREKNRKRKEKSQWGRKLEGEKERELLMRIEKDREKENHNLPTDPYRVTNANEVWDLLVSVRRTSVKTDCSINTSNHFYRLTEVWIQGCTFTSVFIFVQFWKEHQGSHSCAAELLFKIHPIMCGLVNEKSL